MHRAPLIVGTPLLLLLLAVSGTGTQAQRPIPSGMIGAHPPTRPLTATLELFGDGRDGDLVISTTTSLNSPAVEVSASGQQATPFGDPVALGFQTGDAVLFYQAQGAAEAGQYEFNVLTAVGGTMGLAWPLLHTYGNSSGRAQVIKVPQYANVTLTGGAGLSAAAWDGSRGGILVFLVRGTLDGFGGLNMTGGGFKGGTGNRPPPGCSQTACGNEVAHGGDSAGTGGGCPSGGSFGGGHGGIYGATDGGAGGGGGYGSSGTRGQGPYGGVGGPAFGLPDLSRIFLGAGGGGGAWGSPPYGGGRCNPGEASGRGGGIILIQARTVAGASLGLRADGMIGGDAPNSYAGGGGAGGSIKLIGDTITLGGGYALGGVGGQGRAGGYGGNGGAGRIRVEYCTNYSGTTTPPASVQQVTSCPPPPVLAGHLTWQGRPPPPDPTNALPLTLTLALSGTTYTYPNRMTDPQSVFTVPLGSVPNGVYTWWAKGPSFLATTGTVTLSGAPVTQQEIGLARAGDVNNDNLVDIGDFTLLRATFGQSCGDPGYDGRADWTGDCLVDISDFTLLRGNFGQAGPPPP